MPHSIIIGTGMTVPVEIVFDAWEGRFKLCDDFSVLYLISDQPSTPDNVRKKSRRFEVLYEKKMTLNEEKDFFSNPNPNHYPNLLT